MAATQWVAADAAEREERLGGEGREEEREGKLGGGEGGDVRRRGRGG